MQKHFLKFRKVFINVACSPLILISNNSELAAKYLPNDIDQSIKNIEIPNINNVLFQGIDIKKEKKIILAENNNGISEESVLISEILIEGWENHPEGRKLELAAYDSKNKILLADEISPDNCRLWDLNQKNDTIVSLDKDRFRNDLGGLIEAYSEINRRINDFI